MTKAPARVRTRRRLSSLSGAGAGAETDIGVSPKLSFGPGLETRLGLTLSCSPILLGVLTSKVCAYARLLEGEASVSVDTELINIGRAGVVDA